MEKPAASGHILVVEDDARMRDLMEKVLARDGTWWKPAPMACAR